MRCAVLAVVLGLQALGLGATGGPPEWNLDGLDGGAGAAAGQAAVTLAEVRAACTAETAACEQDEECAAALAESFAPGSVPSPRPPSQLVEVMKCFKSGNSPESAKRTQAAMYKSDNVKKITDDVACQFCGHLVEDMWSMVVQNVYQKLVQTSVEQEARVWLEDLCTIGQPAARNTLSTLEKFVGLYDISEQAGGGGWRIVRDVPWAGDPEGAYTPTFGFVGDYEEEVAAKATLEDRQWSKSLLPGNNDGGRAHQMHGVRAIGHVMRVGH